MKAWILNVIYFLFLLICFPVLIYRVVCHGKYRVGLCAKFFGIVIERDELISGFCGLGGGGDLSGGCVAKKFVVWFHAVSVGEVRLLKPLLLLIRQRHPDWCCVISTTSRTGMDTAVKLYGSGWYLFYCPLDFSWAVSNVMRRLRPDILVLAEQELWPNLIDAAKRYSVKVAIINGRFSESGYRRYFWIRPFVSVMLRKVNLVAVQSETYAGWFRRLGASADVVHVTGSMKFDGASFDRNNEETQRLRLLAGLSLDDVVFVAGSTQSPEELFAVECYKRLRDEFPRLRLIIVPRHTERFEEVAKMLDAASVNWERRSSLVDVDSNADGCVGKFGESRVLLVDKMGELWAWWGVASIAFVGGSMGTRGGQNMIEPAAYGAAVCFGPNTKNFADIVDLLLGSNCARVVRDCGEMENFVRNCLESESFKKELGQNGQNLVKKQLGATERTLNLLQNLIYRR
ncbi:MAG: 3-deoxy-D-manno-octulosonic acid transferase [Planctomycetaceae bacterium]|jgi:3-deoxy-D-manno-octulosonic-acid transferase|nr:3-deoxy-D-manno-octulosonic acid transferase [Planctomycetaceae bacterium]